MELLLLMVVFLLSTVSGCHEDSSETKDFDSVIYVLEESTKKPIFPIDVKKRADLAISKWENGVLDTEPILINARLGKAEGCEQIDLFLTIFDEDEDVLGFVIKEEYIGQNDIETALEEKYPAYIHCTSFDVADVHVVPIQIWGARQPKDELLWQEYTKADFKEMIKKYIHSNDFSVDSLYPGKFWKDTLPPIWVSIPEPNKVDVWVSIYDKAGNKSEEVKLLDLMHLTH